MNPFDALATFVLDKIKEGLYAQWLKFLFELAFSGTVSFLFICGGVLVSSASDAAAVGSGMIAAAIAMTALFRRERSRLTKGMIVILPGDEAAQEIATGLQTIEKPEEKK
jgi:hypothetical protein